MTKEFYELREQVEDLKEFRVIRAGAAVFYAAKVRESGTFVERKVNEAKQHFAKARPMEALPKKMNEMMEGMTALGDAMIGQRKMLGNLTGVAVTAALLAERSDKQMAKMIKGNKRR